MNQSGKGAQVTISTYIAAIFDYLKKQDEKNLKVSREDSNFA